MSCFSSSLMRICWVVFAGTVFSLAVLMGQSPALSSVPAAQQFVGKRIGVIEYSPASTLNAADLDRVQPIKSGDPFNPDEVAKAVDGLFSTGSFEDIAVEAEPAGNQVKLRFVTTPVWFIGGVTVEGKVGVPPNRGQIAIATQFTLGAPFREDDIKTAIDSIKALMSANGLYEASVTPEINRENNAQQVFLSFQIKEGKRARYEQPAITGDALMLSNSTILRATGWRIPIINWWRQVTDARTRMGVQSLRGKYESQDRLTAKVDVKGLDYNAATRRVRPSLDIRPGPKVEIKAVEAKVSKKVLKRYVPVYEEKVLYTDLLVEGKRNLQNYFQSRGYYDVVVDFRELPPSQDKQVVEYAISRGSRYKLTRLVINGNKYFRESAIRERMFMTPAAFNLRHGRYSEAFRAKDEGSITDLYKSNGFQDVKVTSTVDRNYQGKAEQVSVMINISEGPQWIVDSVTLKGFNRLANTEFAKSLASSPGQPFAEANLAQDRSTILTSYFSYGFPSATMKAEWNASSTPQHVNVVYTVQEGRQEFVRDVVTSGLRTTREGLVNSTITMKAGDPLSPVHETEIQKHLYDLGIFARVDTAIENPEGDTEHKYVLYNFDEANRYNLALGLGAQVGRFGTPSTTSLSSPGGQTGFSPEVSADLTRLNFLGLGHKITLRGLYSTIEKRASLSYLQPRFMDVEGRNLTYSILYDHTLNVTTFSSKREEASIQMSERFSKSLTGLFRFAFRRVSVSDVIIPVLQVPEFLQPVRIGILSANLSRDKRDNSGDPHRGSLNTLDIGLSTKYFGSERSFGRVLVRNATYYRLTSNVVLARQTQFGVIMPFSPPAGVPSAQSVPLPERFFGGGPDSLRAFAYNQAGPRDVGTPLVVGGAASQPTGFPLGGNALFFNNVELRFPLIGENVQGVLFHDMGNVFSSFSNISLRFNQKNTQDFNYSVHAVGFGVRYRTPVGPIRLDLAYSINPPTYLGFGGTPEQLLSCNPNLPPSSLPSYCQSTKQTSGHFQFFFSIGHTF
jgi:outer membrane protein assembly complex protein YaeT